MKMYMGVDVYMHDFSPSALVRGECPSSHPLRFTPGEGTLGTLWIRCVNPRPCLDSKSDLSFVQPVVSRYADRATATPRTFLTKFNVKKEGKRLISSQILKPRSQSPLEHYPCATNDRSANPQFSPGIMVRE
jgi:hypothetical protein